MLLKIFYTKYIHLYTYINQCGFHENCLYLVSGRVNRLTGALNFKTTKIANGYIGFNPFKLDNVKQFKKLHRLQRLIWKRKN